MNNGKKCNIWPITSTISLDLPEPEGLKFKAVRETSVEVQWDPLNIPFDGWNLIFRNTVSTLLLIAYHKPCQHEDGYGSISLKSVVGIPHLFRALPVTVQDGKLYVYPLENSQLVPICKGCCLKV